MQPPGVTLTDALRAAAGLLRRRAGTVLPYYALLAATADVARVPLLVGAVVVYAVLASTGRLGPLVDDLAALNPELLGGESSAGVPPELAERLAATLFSPAVVLAVGGAVLVAVVCYLLARGVTRAATLAAVEAALAGDGRDPLVSGVDGVSRWRTFAGLAALRWGVVVVALVPVGAAVLGVVGSLGTAPTPEALDQGTALAVLAAVVGTLVASVVVLVALALLAFAGPATVVDGVGLGRAVRRSAGVPFAHPGGFVLYAGVVVAGYVALGVVGAVLGVGGVTRPVALVSAFLLAPLLDGVAVALYVGWAAERDGTDEEAAGGEDDSRQAARGSGFEFGVATDEDAEEWDDPDGVWDDPPGTGETTRTPGATAPPTATTAESESKSESGDEDRSRDRDGDRSRDRDGDRSRDRDGDTGGSLRGALRAGVAELGGFVRHDWGYVLVAAAVLAGGIAGGWGATSGYGVRIGGPDDPGAVFGAVPIGPFVEIAVNNWLVATSAGFSGLFAGVPTVATLLFNGLLVGAVAGVVDPLVFGALVLPHGVIELPAIAVAGGVGLRLGHVAWGTWRGTLPPAALAEAVGRTWRLVVGLAVVFVVAGFVEAFVTPQVAAAVLS
jgi:hypothetical protein